MPLLTNREGIALHFVDEGSGMPVILLHGFGMSADSCWGSRGWYPLLNGHGFRAIALDSRGHGQSAKLTDPALYDSDKMKADVIELLDHLGVEKAFFIGHSMGARTVINLLAEDSARVLAAVLVSVGENAFTSPNTRMLADALIANDPSVLPPALAPFVEMLLSMGNDAAALAAYCMNPRPPVSPEYLAGIDTPVKIVCGSKDFVVGDANKLAAAIRNSDATIVAECEHTDVLSSSKLQALATDFFTDCAK
ncbi:MAG: alpha/beta hydrolase [Sphingomonadaceae bacterium]|nr:alpha/beta hydrolase [Sphingobium sp.]MBP9159014.1 alpha/beta hydrolase [Sphingobium sp.]MCC6481359.1 alpha/beta hydrolase [Sphingomonadaceae bacterium]